MVLSETETMKPHVAVLPNPGMGHVIPLLELAKRLVLDHDVRVSFLHITTDASPAQTQLVHSPTLPPGLHVIDLPPADISTLVSKETRVITRLCITIEESLKTLKSVLIDLGKPRALVLDIFCTQAFEICKELSIPAYSFSVSSTAFVAFSSYLPTLDLDMECEFFGLPKPLQVPGCTPVQPENYIDEIRDRKIDEFKWVLFHLNRLPMAAGIFSNSWEGLEPASLKAIRENPFYQGIPTPPVHQVGPLIKPDESLENESVAECLAWLDKQPPNSVVYVALGSGGTLSAAQLTELAWGLEMSQQRFMFVARKPNDSTAMGTFFNVGGDVDGPKAYLPESFFERTKELGVVLSSWAPQVRVLGHPSTGAFLSHCGWNSVLESTAHGVPMIAWPLYAEQRMIAAMVVEEIGIAVKPAEERGKGMVIREEIERVVRLVMEGEEGKVMRRRARELKVSAEKARKFGGSSYESLARVVKQWKADCS